MSIPEPKRRTITLRLPSTLSAYSGGKSQIFLEATTLKDLLTELAHHHPGIWERLCTTEGRVRSHVKIFVNNALITCSDDVNITLNPGQEVIVLPSPSTI